MYVSELIFEITRRCNLACQHCLRGEPQNKDIDNQTINKALEGISGIGIITFTGGEPTLAVDRIQYIYKQIKKRNISLNGFYVVTNGKIASKELMSVLIDLYSCTDYPEDEIGGLTISKDQYHEYENYDTTKADKLYKALSFYHDDHKGNIKMLINEGRARGMGHREVYLEELVAETNNEGTIIERVDSTIYINALGDVIPSCDMSFESQEENKLGNVNDKPLSKILFKALETL
jgi:MoaA/NifB/PqqE/SkfB family radical SAM enzyme